MDYFVKKTYRTGGRSTTLEDPRCGIKTGCDKAQMNPVALALRSGLVCFSVDLLNPGTIAACRPATGDA